ncbi:MAG: class I SAM-dependent methyltransferase [Betaproteobacteria bacterium]|nr:class I SAM-dependent methyltransferase [Betaproteobacteria bacterium]
MKIHLEPTGERVIEDAYMQSLGAYTIYAMHAASYRFVEAMCAGKKVLDFGCGSGYGTWRISEVAGEIHGVDVAGDAVAYANSRYKNKNLNFIQIQPGSPLPFPDACFDVILSFQVIEHVSDDDAYLQEAHRLLKPDGTVVVITPDRKNRLLPYQKPWNRWHLREYGMEMLASKISKRFRITSKLRMGAQWKIAATEIKRYTHTKWLTLPVTLPFIPEPLRRGALDFIHTLLNKIRPSRSASTPPASYGFDETDFIIDENPPHSINLIVVATRSCAAPHA